MIRVICVHYCLHNLRKLTCSGSKLLLSLLFLLGVMILCYFRILRQKLHLRMVVLLFPYHGFARCLGANESANKSLFCRF